MLLKTNCEPAGLGEASLESREDDKQPVDKGCQCFLKTPQRTAQAGRVEV
jgi:hypothetical protein